MSANLKNTCFLDTNILVYAYDRSAGKKHTTAVQLIRDCWENENGCLSIQILQEFYVNVTHKIASPLDHLTARQIVADLAQWRIQTPVVDDLLQAMDFQHCYQLSFWDAMVVQSAARLGCKQLLSEDLNHGQIYGDVQVINPFVENG
ncbi:MAG: PIN domain-containing protein [Chloroflexota bacterium]|nr:MAG: PIN domain-containing protein [Chloroflexota bacterium]